MAQQRLTDEQLNEDPELQLKNFKRTKDFFVAIDTDGCITGNMNVNRTFPHISAGIPLFNGVSHILELMSQHADIMVVSKTVYEDLANYWEAQDINKYVQLIAGQEMGTKVHHIELAKQYGGYSDEEVLMIGDGNGDLEAAKENNGLFYPVILGKEQEDWDNFPGAFKKFTSKKYKGEFEDTLIGYFSKTLLKTPPWEEAGYDHIRAYREIQPIRKTLYGKYNPGGRLAVL